MKLNESSTRRENASEGKIYALERNVFQKQKNIIHISKLCINKLNFHTKPLILDRILIPKDMGGSK